MKKNNKGFSLIELSIVLIIMGLLIAGVTGGASLIKSAKLRSVITEFTNYRTAFNTYYAQFGKVPGADDNEKDKIYALDGVEGAFMDLYREGIIDREPNFDSDDSNFCISSKFGNSTNWYLLNASIGRVLEGGTYEVENSYIIEDFVGLNVLILSGDEKFTKQTLTYNEAQNIDEKVDDGKSKSGLVRGIFAEAGGDAQEQEYDYSTENTTEKGKYWSLVSKMDF